MLAVMPAPCSISWRKLGQALPARLTAVSTRTGIIENQFVLASFLSKLLDLFHPLKFTTLVYLIAWSKYSDAGFNSSKTENAVLNFVRKVTKLPPGFKW